MRGARGIIFAGIIFVQFLKFKCVTAPVSPGTGPCLKELVSSKKILLEPRILFIIGGTFDPDRRVSLIPIVGLRTRTFEHRKRLKARSDPRCLKKKKVN